jgi:hypothetical protein
MGGFVIVIPMLGRSSRFFEAGYKLPKYQLPLGNETVFAKSVRTFEEQFSDTPFLFLIRADHNTLEFVTSEITRLGIKDFRIKEFDYETRGQAESVFIGVAEYDEQTPLLIFNIDTIRINFEFPKKKQYQDGYLEVFKGEGDGWSFIEPDLEGKVKRATEKNRISDLCSNGLYFFSRCKDFREAYVDCLNSNELINGEIYVAPLYNYLIKRGLDIGYILVEKKDILHCGIPKDYENLRKNLSTTDL